tara:strand:+ start:1638 stop:2153 length:516 start_codon:yes stop_codon:yes gene_type:complete
MSKSIWDMPKKAGTSGTFAFDMIPGPTYHEYMNAPLIIHIDPEAHLRCIFLLDPGDGLWPFIGSTSDLTATMEYHKHKLANSRHINKELQRRYNSNSKPRLELTILSVPGRSFKKELIALRRSTGARCLMPTKLLPKNIIATRKLDPEQFNACARRLGITSEDLRFAVEGL